ncbi:MAG: hypothetical protein FGM37_07380 [Phycisphaerales bacterium]|nr:hypothetical protein [Phycisphaerales bacterium]
MCHDSAWISKAFHLRKSSTITSRKGRESRRLWMRRRSSIGADRYDIGVHGRTRILKAMAVAAGAAALAALAGCPADSTAPTLSSATGRYDAGQYERALSEGEAVAARGRAHERPQAELVAGMAAFQLDRFDAAERHFLAAERSGDPGIRGRARVMLANIRLEQGRTDDAAALFESGAADLSGPDAEKARRYASMARDGQLGTGTHVAAPAAAAVATRPASAASPPVPPVAAGPGPVAVPATGAPAPVASAGQRKVQPAQRPAATTAAAAPAGQASGVFTVRAGAYTSDAAVRRRVKALAADVRRAKCPAPHIATVTTKDGDTLYAVRIGTFRSRAEAEALLKRLARKDLAVGAI